jgi:hypothetical protein
VLAAPPSIYDFNVASPIQTITIHYISLPFPTSSLDNVVRRGVV